MTSILFSNKGKPVILTAASSWQERAVRSLGACTVLTETETAAFSDSCKTYPVYDWIIQQAREHQLEILRTLAYYYDEYGGDGSYECYVISRFFIKEHQKARDLGATDDELGKVYKEKRCWIPVEKEWDFERAISEEAFAKDRKYNDFRWSRR